MKTLLTVFTLVLLLSACDKPDNKQVLKQLFDNTTFDTGIIKALPYYDSIKQLAVLNIDTLFKFRNSHNIIDYDNGNGKLTKQQRDETEYTFFYNSGTKDFVDYDGKAAMPSFLAPKFRSVFERAPKEIHSFTLSIDSTVQFNVEGLYDEKTNAGVGHELIWKRRYSHEPQMLIKDTILAHGWTYYISVDERTGR